MSLNWQHADWRLRAACLSADPDLFFPISAHGSSAVQLGRAKAVCARCAVRPDCLRYALGQPGLQGVWGGTTDTERRGLRRAQSRRAARAAS
jgi:WhiB family redox-sensing transcriptional regulator